MKTYPADGGRSVFREENDETVIPMKNKTKGQIEAQISEAIMRFEKELNLHEIFFGILNLPLPTS